MAATYQYSASDYTILDAKYFNYPDIPPPLVSIKWLAKLQDKNDRCFSSSGVKNRDIILTETPRRRGRPKKKEILYPQQSDESISDPADIEFSADDELCDSKLDEVESRLDIEPIPTPMPYISEDEVVSTQLEEFQNVSTELVQKKKCKDLLQVEPVTIDSRLYFLCPDCDKKFTTITALRHHHRIHSGQLLKCEDCGRGFINKYLLKCHRRVHTGELFKCPYCERGFTTAELLKVHRRNHTGEKPFICDQCPRRFKTASNLTQHKETHLTEKRYLCPVCGTAFNQRRCLEGHMAVHGEKTHICTECGKQWARKSDLIEHNRVHTGEKPYACSLCDLRFTQASSLKRHTLTHNKLNLVPCKHCDRSFGSQSNYLRHLRKHIEET